MDPIVRTLILKRFRSIPSESVAFDNPTFLIGRNGSGKSNLVDAFDFLAEATVSPLQAVFDKRGGIAVVRNRPSGKSYPPNMGLGVELGPVNGVMSRARACLAPLAVALETLDNLRQLLFACCLGSQYGRPDAARTVG
jgi:hypothetical protein